MLCWDVQFHPIKLQVDNKLTNRKVADLAVHGQDLVRIAWVGCQLPAGLASLTVRPARSFVHVHLPRPLNLLIIRTHNIQIHLYKFLVQSVHGVKYKQVPLYFRGSINEKNTY